MNQDVKREFINGADCQLSVLTTGQRDAYPVVMLHGMRDHALSMLLLGERFQGYRIIAPDLRGHGDSDNSSSYAMVHFLADLLAVFEHYGLTKAIVIGHSLGGHICVRFSSLYPELISQLVLLDGLGPPRLKALSDYDAMRNEQWRLAMRGQLDYDPVHRPMKSADEALQKLHRNNPLLTIDDARSLAEAGVVTTDAGVFWKWDPRVEMIWSTFSTVENEENFDLISSPVLLVTGSRSLGYWVARNILQAEDEAAYDKALEQRERLFKNAASIVIPDAGHMLHFDQPETLAREIRDFLGKP
jgi:pimeloyl-ACP methyl ester carboxylesterase